MRFDLDTPPRPGDGLGFLKSGEWWAGLFQALRRGARLAADPSTGLQVLQGSETTTIALAGSRRRCWGRAATPIGPPSGVNGAQMTGGTVRLWVEDAAGLRHDTGIDVTAYNGWTGETIPANKWMRVTLDGVWTIGPFDCP